MAVHASRTITWKQAIVGFPCYRLANWWNKATYLWTFIREWILGRHYTSWTGRHRRCFRALLPLPAEAFTLVLWLRIATIGGIALDSARHQSVPPGRCSGHLSCSG